MNENEKDLLEKARLARNEYIRNWRKSHKENVKQHNKNYWINKVSKQNN